MSDSRVVFDLYSRQLVQLAGEVQSQNSEFFADPPLPFLAVQIREFYRFCEGNKIVDPDRLSRIILAVFSPSPSCLTESESRYLASTICNQNAGEEARVASIEKFMRERDC